MMILYAMITDVSVGEMFAAGILPGILLMVLTAIYIVVRCHLQPELAQRCPGTSVAPGLKSSAPCAPYYYR